MLSSIGLNDEESAARIVLPPPGKVDAEPHSRQPPVRCVCIANSGSYPAGTIIRRVLGIIRKTRRVLTMKTRRGVYQELLIRSVIGTGAGYQRSAATYSRHAL